MKKLLLLVTLAFSLNTANGIAQDKLEIDIADDGEEIIIDESEIEFEAKYTPGNPIYSVVTDNEGGVIENWVKPPEDGITTHSYTKLVPNQLYSIVFVTDIIVENGQATVANDADIAYQFDFKYETDENIHETDNAKYVFNEIELLDGTMLADKIVAIDVDFTNKTDKPVNPWSQFALDFVGEQETETQIIDLMGANAEFAPDYKQEAVANSALNIKPGATVNVVVGYSLQDPSQPVFIRDRNMLNENGSAFELEVKE